MRRYPWQLPIILGTGGTVFNDIVDLFDIVPGDMFYFYARGTVELRLMLFRTETCLGYMSTISGYGHWAIRR